MSTLPIKDLSEVDISNVVFFELSNPHYDGGEINHMDLSYKFPEDKKYIIGIIKLATRCGLDLKFHSHSSEAGSWTARYYEHYKSL